MTERLVIAGVPHAGKTTLSAFMENVRHTDDLLAEISEWSKQSAAVVEWFREPGPWVIEGASAVRSLRKWLRNEEGKPCDRVIWMPIPQNTLTLDQHRMARGTATIWAEISPELQRLGVKVERKP